MLQHLPTRWSCCLFRLTGHVWFNLTHQLAFKIAVPARDIVHLVEFSIERGLRLQRADLNFVSSSLRMSSRTLQRKLAGADLSFQQVVDRVRRRLAEDLITNPILHIGAIGELLGLSQPASVTRAFNRWFGKSPRQMRKSLPDESSSADE